MLSELPILPPAAECIMPLFERYLLELNSRGAQLTVPCPLFYSGTTGFGDMLSVRVPPGFEEMDDWSGAFRTVWVHREAKAIFTYCEGDLDLTIDTSDDTFQARLESAAEFYKEH